MTTFQQTINKCKFHTVHFATMLLLLVFVGIGTARAQFGLQTRATFGGSNYEYSYALATDSNDALLMAGYTESNDDDVNSNAGSGDGFLVKTDANGAKLWSITVGGSNIDYLTNVKVAPNGNYIVCGYSESSDGAAGSNHGNGDVLVASISSDGNLLWAKNFGGSSTEHAQGLVVTADGDIVVAGSSASADGDLTVNYGDEDAWIFVLDQNGNLLNQFVYGGGDLDELQSIQPTDDGGYICSGITWSHTTASHQNGDSWILKLQADFSLAWEKTIGGTSYEISTSLIQSQDDGFTGIGYTESNDGDILNYHGNGDAFLYHLSSNGQLLWSKCLGGSENDYGFTLLQQSNGNYLLAGSTSSSDLDVQSNHGNNDGWLVQTDASGFLLSEQTVGGAANDYFYGMQLQSNGELVLAGATESTDGNLSGFGLGSSDCWLVKASALTNTQEHIVNNSVLVYPNPSNGNFSLSGLQDDATIEVYNAAGALIETIHHTDGPQENITLAGLAPGFYSLKTTEKSNQTTNTKFIIQ